MLPKYIGRYEVLGQLATGGMAEILLARLSGAGDFNRAVVIKRILPQFAKLPSFVAMFLDEARTIAKIRHPNVVQVHELGEEDGGLFLVLEYVAGENLSSVLKRSVAAGEKLDASLVAWIVAEACGGLHAAHELVTEEGRSQNLVHRDVSPQNLFVGYDGHVKLLDFGVALTDERIARTEAGDIKGKFEYMSPEQARGEPLDRRSDIFAMGIVLYELGTGRRLFKRASPAHALDAICKEPIIPPSRLAPAFPPALDAVCLRALAKKPDDRYGTAAEMRLALLEVARDVVSPVEALAERMRRSFPDRIAEKEELLRRVRVGDAVTYVPAGEVEEQVNVPNVPEAPSPPAAEVPAPTRSSRAPLLLGGLAVVALALAVGVTFRRPPRVQAEPALAPTPKASTSQVPDASASSTVVVHVESTPSGAQVLLGGRQEGTTPLDIAFVRGTVAVPVEVRMAGYTSAAPAVVPDADQRLVVTLQPVPKAKAPTKPASPGGGFRRFE